MYTLAQRGARERTSVRVSGVTFGDGTFVVIAGPCAIESQTQLAATARHVAACGARMLRGGAYKPRTSPYAFQGLGNTGVTLMAAASEESGLPSVTEVLREQQLPFASKYIDMIQIGARNMQNFGLLKAAALTGKPVLLKRSASATLEELLYAAEYILLQGNPNVVLCERGVRGFDPETRNVFDLGGALRLKELTHLPVIADPSHSTGRASLVTPLVLACAAAGLDGVIIEVHPDPARALCDAAQALDFRTFEDLMLRLGPYTAQQACA
ncbi:MAG: hypothetical protein NVS9B12_08930 [Vulcanimicrobiaceae bacterium]